VSDTSCRFEQLVWVVDRTAADAGDYRRERGKIVDRRGYGVGAEGDEVREPARLERAPAFRFAAETSASARVELDRRVLVDSLSAPWTPMSLVPRVTIPQMFSIGSNGRTVSVPAATVAPSSSHDRTGITAAARSDPQLRRISLPLT
jgi:hypothetical protein